MSEQNVQMFFKKKPIRCIENGNTWPSLRDMCIENKLKEQSVRASLNAYGKYGGYHFEFLK